MTKRVTFFLYGDMKEVLKTCIELETLTGVSFCELEDEGVRYSWNKRDAQMVAKGKMSVEDYCALHRLC